MKKYILLIFGFVGACVFIMYSVQSARADRGPKTHATTQEFRDFEFIKLDESHRSVISQNADTLSVQNICQYGNKDAHGDLFQYTSQLIHANQEFNALALNWSGKDGQNTSSIRIEVRVWNGKKWSDWRRVLVSDDLKDNTHEHLENDIGVFSDLLFFENGKDAQYRVALSNQRDISPEISRIKLIFINSTDGPNVRKGLGFIRRFLGFIAPITRVSAADPQKPRIVTRQEWGADESIRTWEPQYKDPVSKVILHHTAGAKGGQQSAAVIRGVYYYHAVTRGWGDIGYNYLVDEHGTIFEGRYGGEHVIGGHAYGYNSGSAGVSVLGNYQFEQLSDESFESLARLSAYISAKNGFAPSDESTFYDRLTPNIASHRDYAMTACPGKYYYNRLEKLRDRTQEIYNNLDKDTPAYQAEFIDVNLPPALRVSQRFRVKASFRNTGTETWHNSKYTETRFQDFITLDTNKPFHRVSQFRDGETWTDHEYRATQMEQETVKPGEIATFEFYIRTPDIAGLYHESFVINSEFNRTISNGNLNVAIRVDTPYKGKLVYSNIPKAIKQGWMIPVTIVYKNIGTEPWLNTGSHFVAMNTNKPIGRTSPFHNERWLESYRPSTLVQSRVDPGHYGHFIVWLRAPSESGTYHLNFSLVAEYFSWIDGSQFSEAMRVD